MSEPKLILKVELVDNKMQVTLGTKHEALLALAIRKAELFLTEVLIEAEFADQPKILKPESEIIMPESLIGKL